MGRVVEGDCATRGARSSQGVAGVRVYLEDGRYSITDDEGKYHFEDVAPGIARRADGYGDDSRIRISALSCAERVRNAGRAYSQFVDVRGGALVAQRLRPRAPAAAEGPRRRCSSRLPSPGAAQLWHTRQRSNVRAADHARARAASCCPTAWSISRAARSSMDRSDRRSAHRASNVLTFALGDVASRPQADALVRTPQATRLERRAHASRRLPLFDSPAQTAQRTAPVENVILRGEMLYESASYRFSPRFDVLDTGFSRAIARSSTRSSTTGAA